MVLMFVVAYSLKNCSTGFNESFGNCSKRYKGNLESGLNSVQKFTKCYISSQLNNFTNKRGIQMPICQ